MISIKNAESYANKIKHFYDSDSSSVKFDYPCSSYTTCSPYEIIFFPGSYFLECWGASGSFIIKDSHTGKGGSGGYSSGIFTTRSKITLYLYIGASVNLTNNKDVISSTYNGSPGGNNLFDGCGGGATDFRKKNGDWNQNPESRIITAAGGGSGRVTTSSYGDFDFNGGNGGGTNGKPGSGYFCTSPYGTKNGNDVETCAKSATYRNGTFGSGAGSWWSGGGGGYYGGGSVSEGASGGGSGYIGRLKSKGKYIAVTKESNNYGFGFAKITILPREMFSCACKSRRSNNVPFILLLFSSSW